MENNNLSRDYLRGFFTCYFSMHYRTRPEHLKTHLLWVEHASKEQMLTEYNTINNQGEFIA